MNCTDIQLIRVVAVSILFLLMDQCTSSNELVNPHVRLSTLTPAILSYIMDVQQITLSHIGILRCEGYMEYPYYPIVATIDYPDNVYLAVKNHMGFYIQKISIKDKALMEKAYMVACEGLPENNHITALEFVKRDIAELNLLEQLSKQPLLKDEVPLYLLVGHSTGHLCLVFIRNHKGKVVRRFNQAIQSPKANNIFSKTLSYFAAQQQSFNYPVWQKFGVLKITSRRSLTYLLRNNTIIHTYSLMAKLNRIQDNFQTMMNIPNLTSNVPMQWKTKKKQVCYIIVSPDYKQIWDDNGFILAFNTTVSNYHFEEKQFFISTFEGALFVFNRITMACEQKFLAKIAIRHVTVYKNIIILCLQDDKAQLINIKANESVNIVGHNSFVSQSAVVNGYLLVSSFDGDLSLTKIPERQQWQSLSNQNGGRDRQLEAARKIKVSGEAGIGAFHIVGDLLICCMQDFSIQVILMS